MIDILDIKDRKLLYRLSINARDSDTQLSKKIGLSKNSVKYRINRLKKQGIIKHFAAVVDLGAMHLHTITLLLKFNEDIYEKPEIIEYFKKHEFADWVITLSGAWDVFAEFTIKDFTHLQIMIAEIVSHFGTSLNTYELFFSEDILRVEHLPEDFYQDLKTGSLPLEERSNKKIKIDGTDRKILHLLNQDSSLHYLEIAKRLDSTIDIIRYRMKQLIEKGVIIKFFPELDLKKLGYTEYLYIISLKNVVKEKMISLKKRIQAHSNITYAFFDITGFNLVFVCAFKSPDGIDQLSRNLRKSYAEIIDKQEYLLVKEQVLFNLFPKGLLKE